MDRPTPVAPTVADQPLEFTRLLYMLSQDMDNLTRHADMKAQIILAINAILTAAASARAPALGSASLAETAAFGCAVATLVLMIASVYFSLRTVVPRKFSPDLAVPRNLFFYGDIAAMSQGDFLRAFEARTIAEVRTEILTQVHAKSHAVDVKFRNVRRAVALLFAAVTVWLVGRLLTALV